MRQVSRRGFIGALGALAAGYAVGKGGLLVPERRIYQVPAGAPVRGHAYLGGTLDERAFFKTRYENKPYDEALCEAHFEEKYGKGVVEEAKQAANEFAARGPISMAYDPATGSWVVSDGNGNLLSGRSDMSPAPVAEVASLNRLLNKHIHNTGAGPLVPPRIG